MLAVAVLAAALAAPQDELDDARLLRLAAGRPPDAEVRAFLSPDLRAGVLVIRRAPQARFVLENGSEVEDPLRWLGWKLPEGKSVLLAGSRDAPRLLVGGVPSPVEGLRDAALFRSGRELAVARRADGGVIVEALGATSPPLADAEAMQEVEGELVYAARKVDGARVLRWGDLELPLGGDPSQLQASWKRTSRSWVEAMPDGARRVVVDGRASPACSALVGRVTFSPNGRRAVWVTQEDGRGRGWRDGEAVESVASIAALRAFNDGGLVRVETWKEPEGESEAWRGRLAVRDRREERVLPRPVYDLEFRNGRWSGLSRGESKSVWVSAASDGRVEYVEFEGRVDRVLVDPEDGRKAWTIQGKDGVSVQIGERRAGPFEQVELFFLDFKRRFGYLARSQRRVRLVVEDQSWEVKVAEIAAPPIFSPSQMTVGVLGLLETGSGADLWLRVLPIE